MRYLIIIAFAFLSCTCYSQRVIRFIDSLTLDTERTWIDIHGSMFTEIGENCNYGLEVTFIRQDNQVIFHQCDVGEWKKFIYQFHVISEDGEHFIELYKNNEKLEGFEFEVQMIADEQNNFITELSLFHYETKSFYTLQSIK